METTPKNYPILDEAETLTAPLDDGEATTYEPQNK